MARTAAPPEMMTALTTIHLENAVVHKGDSYPSDHPHVQAHAKYFAASTLPDQELRQLEADLFADSVADAWQPPPPPEPVRMRAHRAFRCEVITSTSRLVEEGEILLSDDEVFIEHARNFERA